MDFKSETRSIVSPDFRTIHSTDFGRSKVEYATPRNQGDAKPIDWSFEEFTRGIVGEDSSGPPFCVPPDTSATHELSAKAVSHDSSPDLEMDPEQPSLEYEETWRSEMYEVKSSDQSTLERKQKHKIVIRDLSFDDNGPFAELTRIDLLCPVFLAVTEDDEDDDVVLKDIRRKTKSIENLFSPDSDEQGIFKSPFHLISNVRFMSI